MSARKNYLRDPLIFWVVSGRNAFQAFFMFFLIFSGTNIAVHPAASPFYAALPTLGVQVFGIALILGAVWNFLGVYWRGRPERAIALESGSALFLGLVCISFVGLILHFPAALHVTGAVGTLSLCALLGIASFGRWAQCRRARREISAFKTAIEGPDHA